MDEVDYSYIYNLTKEILLSYINQTNYTSEPDANKELHDNALKLREYSIIVFYSIIVVVSVFGNSLVCNIVVRKASMRSTTYIFIANLAFSDLLMTVLNIPFNVARVLLKDWPFGRFMCVLVPLVQVTSVYVSTYTMMAIALDRYRVICKPLMPRLTPQQASKVIVIIWVIAITLALPHGIFNRIETLYSYIDMIRCRTRYPYSDIEKWIILVTFLTQYVMPLSITGMAYFFVIARVWSRDVLGVVTEAQVVKQAKAKWKTIKMLVIVVILFAVLWLPLNLYNLAEVFAKEAAVYYIKKAGLYITTVFFTCHWLAMSSLCWNPFIYCWLNKNFRSGAYSCLLCLRNVGRKLNSSFRSTRETKTTDVHIDIESQSCDSKTDSILQTSKDISICCTTSRQQPDQKTRTSRKKYAKEFIPMKTTVNVENSLDNSIAKNVENNEDDPHSFSEMETSLNCNLTDNDQIKKMSAINV